MSRKTKRRLISFFRGVTILCIVAIMVIVVLLYIQGQQNNNRNHQDTVNTVEQLKKSNDLNNRIIICMLKVPTAQRTDQLEEGCRKSIAQQQKTNTNVDAPTPSGAQATSVVNPVNPGSLSASVSTPAQTPLVSQPTSGSTGTTSATTPQPSVVQSIINSVKSAPSALNQTIQKLNIF